MGADVIKIEPPNGDEVRRAGPFAEDRPGIERSLLWMVLNAGKRGVTLDLESEEGRASFRRLVTETDLVIESFAPGHPSSLGIEHEELRKDNPKLVWVSVTGFGQDGPYRDYKWSDMVGLALGGMLYLWGEPERPPTHAMASQAYYHASLGAAVGGMTALYHAHRTGRGQRVDVSMQEMVTFTLAGFGGITGYWTLEGRNITRAGPAINLGAMVSRVVFPCKDGHVAVSTLFGPHFPRLIELMKRDGAAEFLADDKWKSATRFTPMPGQWQCTQEDADVAEGVLERWLQRYTRAEIMRMVREHELMIFAVQTVPENLESEQLKSRNYFRRIEHESLRRAITYPGPPVVLSKTPWSVARRAPTLGEHNDEVFSAIGVSGERA
jgi:crotonobetainyl-CoA:carnitine CoA-transferase CaiB-like acyl-CoA transferase